MGKVQLLMLCRDSVMHITTGMHLSKFYIIQKRNVIDCFNQHHGNYRLSSIKLLVLIGEVMRHYGWEHDFNRYMCEAGVKHDGLLERYNDTHEAMMLSQAKWEASK